MGRFKKLKQAFTRRSKIHPATSNIDLRQHGDSKKKKGRRELKEYIEELQRRNIALEIQVGQKDADLHKLRGEERKLQQKCSTLQNTFDVLMQKMIAVNAEHLEEMQLLLGASRRKLAKQMKRLKQSFNRKYRALQDALSAQRRKYFETGATSTDVPFGSPETYTVVHQPEEEQQNAEMITTTTQEVSDSPIAEKGGIANAAFELDEENQPILDHEIRPISDDENRQISDVENSPISVRNTAVQQDTYTPPMILRKRAGVDEPEVEVKKQRIAPVKRVVARPMRRRGTRAG